MKPKKWSSPLKHAFQTSVLILFSNLAASTPTAQAASPEPKIIVSAGPSGQIQSLKKLTLAECLSIALDQSRRRAVSKFALAAAEAQHRQTLAGYWPQVGLKAAYQRMDQSPNFLFPAAQMGIPAQTVEIPGGAALVTVPAGILGPDAVQLPVAFPGQSISTSPLQFTVPEQDVRLMDPDSFVGSINATWLLYDGGMRRGFREQASGLVELLKQEARRTDLEIIDGVQRFYYGSVLSKQLLQLGLDTLARMEATLNLTEGMYKEGAGKVQKTDFLDNKIMVETMRAAVALLEKNVEMAQAALANTMGLPWNNSVEPEESEVPFTPSGRDLDQLVSSAYEFSPDWARVDAGLRAAEGAVKTAKSGHYPKVALTGDLHKWWTDSNTGLASPRNKEGWTVGIGMEIPLFDGFLTRNRIAETRARVDKIKQEKFLLRDGIALQIKDTFLGLRAAEKSHQATLAAMTSAQENRDLNIRAYQNELVETEKVIRAQLIEALMSAQHYKTRFDHLALLSQLNLLVGAEVAKLVNGK